MANMMFRPVFLSLFLIGMLYTSTQGRSVVKRDADIEEAPAEEGEKDAEGENAAEAGEENGTEGENAAEADEEKGTEGEAAEEEAKADAEEEAEAEAVAETEEKAETEAGENDENSAENEIDEGAGEVEAEAVPEEAKNEGLGGDVEPEKVPEPGAEDEKGDESAMIPDISSSPEEGQDESVAEESGSDSSAGSDEKWPFNGGFFFDSPFFSFSQVEKYFRDLERAIESIFSHAMKRVGTVPKTYENSKEQVVEVDGRKYLVHSTIIKGGDENNGVSIEAVAAVPADKRRKRSLF